MPAGGTVRVVETQPWREHAACRGMQPELFYPPRGADTSDPKRVCAGCPVRAPCSDVGRSERFGIWGGLSEQQRRRRRRTEAAPVYLRIRNYPPKERHP